MGRSAVALALLAFVFTTAVVRADAAIMTFTDRAAFLAATGATDATGPLPDSGATTTNPQTVGTVTFSTPTAPAPVLFIGTAGILGLSDWTTLNPGPDIAISDAENLNTLFAAPVFSAGFDFVEPSAGGSTTDTCFLPACTDSTFQVALRNGATLVDSFTFNASDDVLAFVGVWSSALFDGLEIREILTVLSADNEYFGRVYTGTTELPVGPRAVPEPATIVLVGVGFIGAAVISLKRRRHA
jgi:hypothetical protein